MPPTESTSCLKVFLEMLTQVSLVKATKITEQVAMAALFST